MVWFWILTAAMILLGLWLVIPPLISKKSADSVVNDELNIAIYRQKLAELDKNEENLSDEQLKQAREELEQGLLQDVAAMPPARGITLTPRTQKQVAAIIAVVLPLTAVLLYAELSPPQPQWQQLVAYEPGQTGQKGNLPSIEEMVARLEAKLQSNPADPKGWSLLGRSYFVMSRYQEAANAYAQADKLTAGNDVDILADYAEAVAMANGGNMKGQAEQIVARALAKQPTHPKSLWLSGTAAFQAGNYQHAIQQWQTLYNLHPDKNNEGAKVLLKQIAEARARLGGKAPPPMAMAQQAPHPAKAKGKTEVKVSVSLDAKLKAKASPDDTVFIFARAVQGPPMPLAIVKKRVRDLPITVSLSDGMAMMPNMTMSSFQQIYIGARVSKSGKAIAQSGDLQGRSSPLKTGKTQSVKVTISQEVL